MNLRKPLTAVLLLAGVAMITACTTTGHEQTGGEYISDSAITTKVKSALLMEKDINSLDIGVETFDRTVQLSGFVDSEWQIEKAEQVAKSVEGVQGVTNDLIHKPKQ